MTDAEPVKVRPYNQRMAGRIARRAGIDETGVAVSFGFNSWVAMLILGLIEDLPIPYLGLIVSIVGFAWHRIVLVTETSVYVMRDWPFHYPGKVIARYDRGPGVTVLGSGSANGLVHFLLRGQLQFHDGVTVYHGFIFIKRSMYIQAEANQAPDVKDGAPATR
jgi:hypothetical protein